MDDDTIKDLKQFIAAAISQELSEVFTRLDRIDHKLDDLSDSVAEAIESSNEATSTQLNEHNERLSRLEQKAA